MSRVERGTTGQVALSFRRAVRVVVGCYPRRNKVDPVGDTDTARMDAILAPTHRALDEVAFFLVGLRAVLPAAASPVILVVSASAGDDTVIAVCVRLGISAEAMLVGLSLVPGQQQEVFPGSQDTRVRAQAARGLRLLDALETVGAAVLERRWLWEEYVLRLRLEFATKTAGVQLLRHLRLPDVLLARALDIPALLHAAKMDGQLTVYALNLQQHHRQLLRTIRQYLLALG